MVSVIYHSSTMIYHGLTMVGYTMVDHGSFLVE